MSIPPAWTPLDKPKAEEPKSPYGDVLRQLLTDIATSDKSRLAAEATIASLSDKLLLKEKMGQKELPLLTQLSEAHDAREQAKKDIDKTIQVIQHITVEPLRQVLAKTPLALTIKGYAFTLSTAPNSVNAWMLDLTVDYHISLF